MDKKVSIQDLAEGLAGRKSLSRGDAEEFVRMVFDLVGEVLKADKIVKIKGLGTFKLVAMEARESVDVNTGERISIKEYTKVSFTPDPVLRDAVNKPFAQFETVVLYEGTDISEMERMDGSDVSESLLEEMELESGTAEPNQDILSRPEADGVVSTALPDDVACEDPTEAADMMVSASIDETVDNDETDDEALDVDLPSNTVAVPEEESLPEPLESPENGQTPAVEADVFPDAPHSDDDLEEVVESAQLADEAGVCEEATPESPEASPLEEEAGQAPDDVAVHGAAPHDSGIQEEMRIASQQVEVQKVAHQTVENQHIVHVTREYGPRRVYLTPWMMFFLVLLVAFLMAVSYYAGSQGLFNGVLDRDYQWEHPAPVEEAGQSAPTPRPVPVVADTLQPAAESADTLQPKPATPIADSLSAPVKQPAPVEVAARPQEIYEQVKNGAYEIVGVQGRHCLRNGETLHSIARKYFGSNDFTVYLIVHNKIADPDIVPEGMWLEIPKLRLKRR